MPTVITFESWVTHLDWYAYAVAHPELVPYLLIDRSPCTDPFFDPFKTASDARPLISGCCRERKHYDVGDLFIYVTRVDRRVLAELGRLPPTQMGAVYFGVAALRVSEVHLSHADTALGFAPGQYVAGAPTAYPPNLAHNPYPGAAVPISSCITHDVSANSTGAHTPASSTPTMHRQHYNFYRLRQRGLPVAECRFDRHRGVAARVLDPATSPIWSAAEWGNSQMNQMGRKISEQTAEELVQKIAAAARRAH